MFLNMLKNSLTIMLSFFKKKKKWNPLSLVHVHLTALLKDIAHKPFVIGMLCLYIIHEDLLIFLYNLQN